MPTVIAKATATATVAELNPPPGDSDWIVEMENPELESDRSTDFDD